MKMMKAVDMDRDSKQFVKNSERGAALVTTLMISALLLIAGGMLILTTSMSGINTVDAAAEMQAYYGAEAGIQAALNVMRGNVPPNPLFNATASHPSNKIDFVKAVNNSTSNLASDPTQPNFPHRLSRWLTYNYTPPNGAYADRVTISPGYTPFSGIAYSITVTDPDNKTFPTRLQITSTGYGPRGARKTLSVLVSASYLMIDEIPATVVLRGHDDTTTDMTLDFGSSGAETYSGVDYAAIDSTKPAVAIVNHDDDTFQDATLKMKSKVLTVPNYGILDVPSEPKPGGLPAPWFLQTANDARSFVAQAEALALKKGVVLNYLDGAAGSLASPQLTVVKGDCHLTAGAGMLVITGNLYIKGSGINYSGLILVLGGGQVIKTGGGNKDVFGSIMVARFGPTGGFLEPTFDVNGGGSSNLQYDSQAIIDAFELTGRRVLGVVEN